MHSVPTSLPQMSHVLPSAGATGGVPLNVHGFPHVSPQFAHHATPIQLLHQQLHHQQFLPNQHTHNNYQHHHYHQRQSFYHHSSPSHDAVTTAADEHFHQLPTSTQQLPSKSSQQTTTSIDGDNCEQEEHQHTTTTDFPPVLGQVWINVALFLTEHEWLTKFIRISRQHGQLIQKWPSFAIDLAKYDSLFARTATSQLTQVLNKFRVRSMRLDSETHIALAYKHKHKLLDGLTSLRVAAQPNLPSGELVAFFTRESNRVEELHFHSFMCSHATLNQLLNRIHDRSRIKHLVLDFVLDEINSGLQLTGFKNLITLKTKIPISDFDELPHLEKFEGKLNCCPDKLQAHTPKLKEIDLNMKLEQFPRYEPIAPYLRPRIMSIETDAHEERLFAVLNNCRNLKYLKNSRPAFLATVTHQALFSNRLQFPNIVTAEVTLFELGDVLKLMYCFPNIQNWEPVQVPQPNCRVLSLSALLDELREKLHSLDNKYYDNYHEKNLKEQFTLVEMVVRPYAGLGPIRQLPRDVKQKLHGELIGHTSRVLPSIVLHCLGGKELDLSGFV
mmetsp:Transcript_2136/g.7764  ORF Transcript_2136/g.7764 Transcript_2136/m.7764 type:complete len:557 (-) Transcript_2136:100-1770(-)